MSNTPSAQLVTLCTLFAALAACQPVADPAEQRALPRPVADVSDAARGASAETRTSSDSHHPDTASSTSDLGPPAPRVNDTSDIPSSPETDTVGGPGDVSDVPVADVPVADVPVTTATGTQTLTTLADGKPLILALVYYGCGHSCPVTLRHLAGLELPDHDQFQVMAVSFDQDDTLETMAAARQSLDPSTESWVFGLLDEDAANRHNLLAPFQVNDRLMGLADKDAIFLHCLPAHREEEVTNSVMDGPQSVVFDEAENRLHAQKAVLAWCMGALS